MRFGAITQGRISNNCYRKKHYGSSNIKGCKGIDINIHGLLFLINSRLENKQSFSSNKENNAPSKPNITLRSDILSISVKSGLITDAKNTNPRLAVNSDNLSSCLSSSFEMATVIESILTQVDININGQIDPTPFRQNFEGHNNARIYNYPLTAVQVKTLYNQGALNYGPLTGAP